jgi:hypothetical protein
MGVSSIKILLDRGGGNLIKLNRRHGLILVVFISITCVILLNLSSYQYYPAATAAPGYSLHVLTQPKSYFEDKMKRLYTNFEFGRPCKYSFLGWSESNLLYYEETCDNNSFTDIWCWQPRDTLKQVKSVPSGLKAIREPVLPYVRVRDWNAPAKDQPLRTSPTDITKEEEHRRTIIKLEGVISPNRRWLAFVAQHLYGPEDVFVIDLAGSVDNDK